MYIDFLARNSRESQLMMERVPEKDISYIEAVKISEFIALVIIICQVPSAVSKNNVQQVPVLVQLGISYTTWYKYYL